MHVEVGDVDKNKQQCVLGVYMLASGKLVADDVVVEPLEFVDVMAGAALKDSVVEDD
jgi:hypothetical protein